MIFFLNDEDHHLSWQLILFDKKQKSCIKRIYLVTDDGLYDRKPFYKVDIIFIPPLWMMVNLQLSILWVNSFSKKLCVEEEMKMLNESADENPNELIIWLWNLPKSKGLHFCNDDDNDDDEELFLWYGWPTKEIRDQGSLSETIANLRHAARRIWTCAEPEFRLFLNEAVQSW